MATILRRLLAALPLVAMACSGVSQPPPGVDRAGAPGAPLTASAPVSAAVSASEPAASPNSSRPRIVFLGDSLTAGLGLLRAQAVPSLIQARLDGEGYRYEVVNAGVSGDTSAGGLRRLAWSLEGDVQILVIELGANDGLRGLPVSELTRNLSEIVARARARGITVVLTGMEAPPNYGPAYTSEFRRAFREVADEHDVSFVPFYLDGVAGNPALNNADGIHPNIAGARVIEQTLWRALEPLLDRQDQ